MNEDISTRSEPCEICGHRICSHEYVTNPTKNVIDYRSRLKETDNMVSLTSEDSIEVETVKKFVDERKKYIESEISRLKVLDGWITLKNIRFK